MLLCRLLVLHTPSEFTVFYTFLSAVIGFLNSTVMMRLCQPSGEIAYLYMILHE